MSDQLITYYDFEIAEAACAPGSGRYGIRVMLVEDISRALPFLNTVLQDTVYDKDNAILTGRDNNHMYAFRPTEIRVAGVNDVAEAPEVVRSVIDLVNRTWQQRNTIKPSHAERKVPAVMDIYRHLPKTNCRKCGDPTCLVFASELRAGKRKLEQCPPLCAPENAARREAVEKLVGWGDV
jgi:ArsR family metal-binding transcriptional regulator